MLTVQADREMSASTIMGEPGEQVSGLGFWDDFQKDTSELVYQSGSTSATIIRLENQEGNVPDSGSSIMLPRVGWKMALQSYPRPNPWNL